MRNSAELKKAQIRLTILHSLITGIIVSVIVWLIFYISLREYRNQRQSEFLVKADSIASEVTNLVTVNNSWLNQLEDQDEILVEIGVSGYSLERHATWMEKEKRALLFQKAMEKAALQGIDTQQKTIDFHQIKNMYCEVSLDHVDYLAYISIIPENQGNYRSVILIKRISFESSFLRMMILNYLAINVGGIIIFTILSFILVGKMLKPVKIADERQCEFIACASHELKSPVAVIRSSAEAIKVDHNDSEVYLDNIESECLRMAHLVDDLLLLSRSANANQWVTAQQTVSIDTLLVDVFDAYYMVCKKSGFSMELELGDDEIGCVQGDSERLKQVLFILLDNAITYSKENKKIKLTGLRRKNLIIISVEDHGIGINDKEKKKVFERFYRSNHSYEAKHHVGLGLSIAKELIRLHQGNIRVEDTLQGGATFVIELPVNVQNPNISKNVLRMF